VASNKAIHERKRLFNDEIQAIENRLNNRTRKVLQYKTPVENEIDFPAERGVNHGDENGYGTGY